MNFQRRKFLKNTAIGTVFFLIGSFLGRKGFSLSGNEKPAATSLRSGEISMKEEEGKVVFAEKETGKNILVIGK